jgi:hypothetical protein
MIMKKGIKSTGAILAGFIAVVVPSIATDVLLETTKFFPPQNRPELYTGGLLLIAFIYRSIYTVAGGWVAAILSPDHPMRHSVILGMVGMVAGTLGAVANWDKTAESAAWYPVALVIAALPCTWLGGKLFETKKGVRGLWQE